MKVSFKSEVNMEGSTGNPFEVVINSWYDIIVPILGIAPNVTSTLNSFTQFCAQK
jgi:hypothetical protein